MTRSLPTAPLGHIAMLLFALTVGLPAPARAQHQEGINVIRTTASGGAVWIELISNPPISTPDELEFGGGIEVIIERRADGTEAEWVPAEPKVSHTHTGIGSPATQWTFSFEFHEPFEGRIRLQQRSDDEDASPVGSPAFVEVSRKVRNAAVTDFKTGQGFNAIDMLPGRSSTLYVTIRNVDDDSVDTSWSGTLRMSTVDGGHRGFGVTGGPGVVEEPERRTFGSPRLVRFSEGRATITLLATPSAEPTIFEGTPEDGDEETIGGFRVVLEPKSR